MECSVFEGVWGFRAISQAVNVHFEIWFLVVHEGEGLIQVRIFTLRNQFGICFAAFSEGKVMKFLVAFQRFSDSVSHQNC